MAYSDITCLMSESVRAVLDHLEREVSKKIADLRRSLIPLERELADIRRAKSALSSHQSEGVEPAAGITIVAKGYPPGTEVKNTDLAFLYRKLTMKKLALKALEEHFENGATASELLKFFADAWGRTDILRESFSPQLSRLKSDGLITYDGKRWHLARPGKQETSSEPESEGNSEPSGDGDASPDESQQSKGLLG